MKCKKTPPDFCFTTNLWCNSCCVRSRHWPYSVKTQLLFLWQVLLLFNEATKIYMNAAVVSGLRMCDNKIPSVHQLLLSFSLSGYDHLVHREGCAPRTVRLNACLGGCPSFTIPLSGRLRAFFPNKLFISRSRCCSIKSTHDVSIYTKIISASQPPSPLI